MSCAVLKILGRTVCWHTLPWTYTNSHLQEVMYFVFHLERPFKVRIWTFDSLLQYYLNKLHLYVNVWYMIYTKENWCCLEAEYTSEIRFIVISFTFFPLENSATLSVYWCLRTSLSFQGSDHKSSRSYSKVMAYLKTQTTISYLWITSVR